MPKKIVLKAPKKKAPTVPTLVERRMWRVDEFSANFRICETTTYKLIREGKLKSIMIGGRRLIPIDAADELMKNGASF